MIKYAHKPELLALCLCFMAVVASLLLFLLSLPFLSFGLMGQSEPASAALHFCAATCAGSLLVIFLARPRARARIIALLAHPFVAIPGIIGLYSLLIMPFMALPIRHLLGAPQTGEGAMLWLSWAMLAAGGMMVFRIKTMRSVLEAVFFMSLSVVFILVVSNYFFGNPITPYNFPDFMGILPFTLYPIIWRWRVLRLPKGARFWWVFIIINALAWLTQNNMAIAFGLFGLGFFALLYARWPAMLSRKYLKPAAIALIPIPPALIYVLTSIFYQQAGYYPLMGINIFGTIASRTFLMKTALQENLHSLKAFFLGSGWGTFTENLTAHMPLEWINLILDRGEQWDGITTDHFHAHNIFAETFMAIGIAGPLMLLALIVSVPVFARSNYKFPALVFSGAWAAIGSLWFFFPLTIPFMTLALAACAGKGLKTSALPWRSAVLVLPAVTLVLGPLSSFMIVRTALSTDRYDPPVLAGNALPSDCHADIKDFGAGGTHLAQLLTGRIRTLSARMEAQTQTPPLPPEDALTPEKIATEIGRINNLFCQSQHYVQDHKPSRRLRVARLIARGETLIGLAPYLDAASTQMYADGWRPELESWLEDVPSRPDMATTYLLWSLANGHERDVYEIARKLRAANPNDPLGLWFEGIVLTGDPAQSGQGIVLMRRALEGGVDRLVPVDENLRRQLQN